MIIGIWYIKFSWFDYCIRYSYEESGRGIYLFVPGSSTCGSPAVMIYDINSNCKYLKHFVKAPCVKNESKVITRSIIILEFAGSV